MAAALPRKVALADRAAAVAVELASVVQVQADREIRAVLMVRILRPVMAAVAAAKVLPDTTEVLFTFTVQVVQDGKFLQ